MTSVWGWVRERRAELEQGDPQAQRLAELIRTLPAATADEAHAQVDAMVPEALDLARELDEPWVELFVRHWHLQSRVLHRRQAADELREAVSLLDFASGPRTRACPQSVCAVQDLAVCYSIRDGPGYVEERLAVARETLARIDPSWSCFECISTEYVSALHDDQRPAEALAFVDAQIAKLAEHGDFDPGFGIMSYRAQALVELGQPEQALEILDGLAKEVAGQGRSREMSYRMDRVRALLALGREQEALALHPPLSAIRDSAGHFRDWLENHAALIDRGHVANTDQVGRELLEIQRQLVRNGARWDAALTTLTGARLALARGATVVAGLLLADFDGLEPLRRPELLAERRRELGETLAHMTPVGPSPATLDPRHDDPERVLDAIAADATPGAWSLARATALRRIGRADAARVVLEREAATGALPVIREFAQVLLDEHDHGALDALLAPLTRVDDPDSALDPPACWIYGESLVARGELAQAVEFDRRLLARGPEWGPLALRMARTARELGDWETALAALDAVVDQLDPGEADWDRITAATVLGRWPVVRSSAARLGIALPPGDDEPLDLDLGRIRCEFVEPSGERVRYWARRSSPCAATILEIAMPRATQHYRDRVVFEPVDLDSHQRSENERPRPSFAVVAIVEPGGWEAFLLRGHDPGAEQFDALVDALEAAGWGVERITAPGRSAPDPRNPGAAEQPTVAVLVAIPEHDEPARLRDQVRALTRDWPLPLLDPRLDLAANEPTAAAEATALLERWRP